MVSEASRNLDLEVSELMWIESCLTPSQMAAVDGPHPSEGPDQIMCLKVGTALLEALGAETLIAVSFTEDELWLLRERVDIYASQGANTRLGLGIKVKVYQALLSISNERAAGAVLSGLPGAGIHSEEAMSSKGINDAVRQWSEANKNPRSGASGDDHKKSEKSGADDPTDRADEEAKPSQAA